MQLVTPKNIFSGRSLARGLLILSLLLSSSWLCAQQATAVDPALVQTLKQATHDIREKTTDIDSLVWLSSMSERLEKRIKNPFYRVRLLKTLFAEA
ncbi:MAG: hypothetical protein ACI9FR_000751 [Cryomorphaceae bacterium]|jgi:hypothetical protein